MNRLTQLIIKHSSTFAPILPLNFNTNNIYKLNLSVSNQELLAIKEIDTPILSKYINNKLLEFDKNIALGGYGEDRVIYKKSTLFKNDTDTRSIHLGIDIWCNMHTNVSAPLDSKIHSFNNNDNYGDYGPTIILEHCIEEITFYTLYGHLSKDSLTDINTGDIIKKGESFAQIGESTENGNWPPHLHFQLINNIGKHYGDFPGVSSIIEKDKWLGICPDPEIFFQ